MADVYLAVKYLGDHSNRERVEQFRTALANEGVSTYCVAADLEVWGERAFTPAELMSHSFERISSSSVVLVEFSEKGVGLGIEAGYAAAHGIPVIVVLRDGADLSTTMAGVARAVLRYQDSPGSTASEVARILRDSRAR